MVLNATCVLTNKTCPEGTYNFTLNNKTAPVCKSCNSSCGHCNATKCLANCSANCSDCIGNKSQICLACDSKHIMVNNFLFTNKCLNTTCDALGLFFNSSSKQCDVCPSYCDSCDSRLNCKTCSKGYFINNMTLSNNVKANFCTK